MVQVVVNKEINGFLYDFKCAVWADPFNCYADE